VDEPRTPVERLEADLHRTVDRLRTLGLARLAASFEPEPTRADAARGVAQRLADAAADLEGGPRRTLPRLADAAVGDQVAACWCQRGVSIGQASRRASLEIPRSLASIAATR